MIVQSCSKIGLDKYSISKKYNIKTWKFGNKGKIKTKGFKIYARTPMELFTRKTLATISKVDFNTSSTIRVLEDI